MKRYIDILNIRCKYFLSEKIRNVGSIVRHRKVKINTGDAKKKAFIFLAADYGNIGDVAITYAQKKYLESKLPDYEIIEVPYKKNRMYVNKLKKTITDRDIITIVGGGNMTNRYDAIEEARRIVIKKFRRNTIISFPQTIEFTDDIKGQESFRRTKKIYSKCKNLVIFAREPNSYEKMKRAFDRNRVIMVPDIVMSLKGNIEINTPKSNKIGICLRDDKEKFIKMDIEKLIREEHDEDELEKISTHIGDDNFVYEKREEHIFELLEKIKEKKLVITDRLHGMIFCYITGTPCIAFDNDNHKIRESYNQWLKNCNYIKLLDENDGININEYIKEMENVCVEDHNLKEDFKKMEEILVAINKMN